MIIRVVRLQVLSVKYACVMDIIRIFATSRAVVKETQGLLEPNEVYRGDHARANHVIDEEKEQRYNNAAQEDDRMQLLQAVTDSDLYVFAASDLSKFKKGRISVLIDNKVLVKF